LTKAVALVGELPLSILTVAQT